MTQAPVKRALISVSDKTNLIEFAQNLVEFGVEILSTGGTSQLLREAQIPHRQVDEITGLPEMLNGRVKTLHPLIHGGILGKRDQHAKEVEKHGIHWIDLVVVNFYPFNAATKEKKLSWEEAVEYIDIGGPTMVRAAAKNFAWVGVITDPLDYVAVIKALKEQQSLDFNFRKQLAKKAFALTNQYDALIHQYFLNDEEQANDSPAIFSLTLEKYADLRYGENPHQKASAYQLKSSRDGILSARQYQGKPLSYNNILDAEAALHCVQEFTEPAAVIIKHANPCGVAIGNTIDEAYARAYAADSTSAFGGIVALNQACTKQIAEAITAIFMEVIIAPHYTEEALAVFAHKPNLRVLSLPLSQQEKWEMKFITGGMLLQERDLQTLSATDLHTVTLTKPTAADMNAMLFAWRVVKHIKSNAILIATENATVGVGAGQVSRIDAVHLAIRKASHTQGAILASDAFFPFRDSIDCIAQTGIRAIIQPGGSLRDEEVIAACNEHQIAMVFTGKRCFRH